MSEDPEATELRERQQDRVREEERLERRSHDEEEAAAHRRRSEKADYLREKLAEREQTERSS